MTAAITSTSPTSSSSAGRDSAVVRARTGDLCVFAASGVMLATWMARLPDVKAMLHLTPGLLGVLLLAYSIGALTGLPLAGRLVQRRGTETVVRVGAVLMAVGMAGTAVAVTGGWLLAAPMVGLYAAGFGTGIWNVGQNLQGAVIEQAAGRSTMPWFHAAFSAGAVAGALATAALIHAGVPFLAHLLLTSAGGAAAVWWGTSRFLPTTPVAGTPAAPATREPSRGRSAWTEPRTLLIGVMVLAATFAEGAANDWLAVAFVDGHGVTAVMGVAALAVFLACMTLGRILGTRALDRYGRVRVLRVLFACALVGSMLVVFAPTPAAYLGAAVWGVGVSLGFPVGMSAAADHPHRAAARLSVVTTIGYGAFLTGPAVIGLLGDHVGVLHALTVVGLMSAFAFAVAPATRPRP